MATKVLRVVIAGDASGALKSFHDVESGSAKMGGKIEAGASKLVGAATVAAAGVAAAVAAIGGIGIKSADTFQKAGLETGKLQRYTGDTAENTSRLREAFKLTGVDSDKSAKAMGLFSKSIEGGKLKGYGIDIKDAHGKMLPFNDILMKTADHFAKAPNGPAKTAAALKLFGKAGMDMLPFLNRGATGIAELEKQSDKLGTTLSDKDVKAAKESVAAHRKFSQAMEGLQIMIGRYVLPVLTKMIGWLADRMPTVIKYVKEKIEEFRKKWEEWQPTIERIRGKLADFATKFMDIVAGIKKWWDDHFDQIKSTVTTFAQTIMDTVAKIKSWWNDHWDQIKTSVVTALNIIKGYIEIVVGTVQFIWRNFGKQIVDVIATAWNYIKSIFHVQLNIIMGIVRTVMAIIHGDWGEAWNQIKNVLGAVWDGIKAMVRLALGVLKNILTMEWTVIKAVALAAWETIKGAISGAWEGIKAVVLGAVGAVVRFVSSAWSTIAGGVAAAWNVIVEAVKGAIGRVGQAVLTGISNVVVFFRDLPGRAISAMGDMGSALWQVGSDFISGLYNGIVAALGNVWVMLGELPGKILQKVKDAIPGAGVVGDLLGNIPGLAGGAENYRGGFTIVGEKGPELVHLPRGSDVYTAGETRGMMAGKSPSRPAGGGGGTTIHVHVAGSVLSDRDLVEVLARAKRRGLMPA